MFVRGPDGLVRIAPALRRQRVPGSVRPRDTVAGMAVADRDFARLRATRRLLAVAVASVLLESLLGLVPNAALGSVAGTSRAAAVVDDANLRLAAAALQTQAIASGVLSQPVEGQSPAAVILTVDEALIAAARSGAPADTRSIMGPLPYAFENRLLKRPSHRHITRTRTLRSFVHAVPTPSSNGVGHRKTADGVAPARFRPVDGVYVQPRLPLPVDPTIAIVALRTALGALGQPYVWAGSGPSVYDCSGLVMRAYGSAGIALVHHAATQWNEGRLLPPRDVLPGDLIMFGDPIFHVGIYLGAGWMLNAPFTGHYVDVVPVPIGVAGVVRL
jgi:NlpC/P60 family